MLPQDQRDGPWSLRISTRLGATAEVSHDL
jgi:hypothetical protein